MLELDFEGYDPLQLTDDDAKLLRMLRRLSMRDGYEYGAAADMLFPHRWISNVFTDHDPNRVSVPPEIMQNEAVALYHSHTNATLFSAKDYQQLLNPQVGKIFVITVRGDAAAAYVGSGYIPDRAEFLEAVEQIRLDVPFELIAAPDFYDLSESERRLQVLLEESFRTARKFGWTLEGGSFHDNLFVS